MLHKTCYQYVFHYTHLKQGTQNRRQAKDSRQMYACTLNLTHLDVQVRLVGLELGLGVKERLVGTGICIEGE